MATSANHFQYQHSSPRALAMVMAVVSALVLSPLYVDHGKSESHLETRWSSSGLMLPALVAGLIIAIKTTSTSTSNASKLQSGQTSRLTSPDSDTNADFVFKMGSSCWGLAGILILLLFVISWQASVKQFFWK